MKNHHTDRIIIFDTTLRDGEQSPGAAMKLNDKIRIATALDHMGVDVIEAGFAAASNGNAECIAAVSRVVKNATVCSLARAKKSDIEAASLSLAYAIKPRIHTFIATSDIHLQHQLKMTQEDVLQAIHDSVTAARNACDDVEWSAMDATRTSVDFLARALETAIKAGAKTVNIPDTVGYTIPDEYAQLIRHLQEKVPLLDKAIISVHCHNDLGLAVANSLAAVRTGARQVECTINGIGERAGNAALEEIVMAIKTRHDKLNVATQIDTTQIASISQLVARATGFTVQKNKAIVGANAFSHESGIHQDGMLKSRDTYEIMTPSSVGLSQSLLVMGKLSGRAAFRHKLDALGVNWDEAKFEIIFAKFKALGDQQKSISDEDILALTENKMANPTTQHENPRVIWMDGEFVAWDEAKLHVLTHGLHYASAVFEGERAYGGRVYQLTEHNERLHQSAAMLGFTIPYSVAMLDAMTQTLIEKNQLSDAYVRPVAWCGTETLSVASHPCKVHVAIAAWEWHSYFSAANMFEHGLKLMWADWIRPSPAMAPVHAKAAGLYLIGTLSKNKAEKAGYHDALMLDYRGYIAECTGANIFMVKDGVIHTPIADCFLNGITRQTIIALANTLHVPLIERHILPHEVDHADEVFITGSAVEVAPIGQIGHQHFAVGPLTRMMADAYQKLVRSDDDANLVRQNLGAA